MKKHISIAINSIIYFILIVTPLLFFTDLTRNPYYTQISLLHASMLLILIVYTVGALIEGKLVLYRTAVDKPLLAFLAVAVLSQVWSFFVHYQVEWFRYAVFSEGAKRLFFTVVNCVLVFYAAVFFVRDENRHKFIITSLVVGVVAAGYGVLQYFGLEFIWPKVLNPFGVRSVSTFGNPNFLSSYMVMLLPVVFYYYIVSRNKMIKGLLLVAGLLCSASLFTSMTRSSWIGAVVGMSFMILSASIADRKFLRREWISMMVFGVLIIVCVSFWPKGNVSGYSPSIKERIFEISQVKEGVYAPLHQRFLIWKCSWDMLTNYPVLGIGWGEMELFYPFYQGPMLYHKAFRTLRTHANNSHNEILEILCQVGIVGFGIYLWLLLTLAFLYFKTLLRVSKSDTGSGLLVAALGAAVVGMLVDNLLNVSVHFAVPAFLYWWFAGIIAGFCIKERSVNIMKVDLNSMLKRSVLFTVCAASLFLVFRTYRFQMNQVHFFSGFKQSQKVKFSGKADIKKVMLLKKSAASLSKAHDYRRFEVNNNYELGNVYARLKYYGKCMWAYREALMANSGYDEIYYNLATIYNQKKNTEKAVEFYRIANLINPLNKGIYTGLSTIYINLVRAGVDKDKNQVLIEDLYKRGLKLFPDERDFWNNLGWTYISTNRFEEALEAYEQTLRIDPSFEAGMKNLSICLKKLGRDSHPFFTAQKKLAGIENLIKQKKYAEAKKELDFVLDVAPRNGNALMYMGNVLISLKRYEDAVEIYNKMLGFYPSNVVGMGNLGIAYIFLKEFEKAADIYSRVAELTKGKPEQEAMHKKALARVEEIKSLSFNKK